MPTRKNRFGKYATKADYDIAFAEARKWTLDNPTESPTTAARIYGVSEPSLRQSIRRAKIKKAQGGIRLADSPESGGHNKVLSTAQETAIIQYCHEQWELGLGATHAMVKSAIAHLLASQNPPRSAPSNRWYTAWLNKNAQLHTLKTKPMEVIRLESHTEEEVKTWFENLGMEMRRLHINSGKKVLNMDESGVRVGCPSAEKVVVPIAVTELYTPTQGSRKTVTVTETVRADGQKPLPPFIICPGEYIMQNWVSPNLTGDETIVCSSSGYVNNDVIMKYGYHLIKYSHAGPKKPWKLLLLDGHESHYFLPFQLLLKENHILPWYFPSHLTHALQPLDVGIFRPWKHYHSLAVNSALRSLDLEYTVTSFFRDLSRIREETLVSHTICNAFKESGIWPLSCKAGLERVRSFSKKNQSSEPELPANTASEKVWRTKAAIESFIGRDPTTFSDNTVEVFKEAMKETSVQLEKAYLTTTEHALLQQKLRESARRKKTSRRTIKSNGGGSAPTVAELRVQISAKAEAERIEELKRATRLLSQAIGKHKESLRVAGVAARKTNKARKQRIQEMAKVGEVIPPNSELLIREREPDKEPNAVESALLTEEGHPALLASKLQYQVELDNDEEVEIYTQSSIEKACTEHVEYVDSSPIGSEYAESSGEDDQEDSFVAGTDYVKVPN